MSLAKSIAGQLRQWRDEGGCSQGWLSSKSGSWLVKPLDYDALGPEHVGRTVIYRDHGRSEAGTITSWRDGIVFAKYSRGDTSAGANPSDLSLGIRTIEP